MKMRALNTLPIRPVTRVLLVGTEQMLLYTRKIILEKRSMLVSIAKPADAVDRMHDCDFDVVITCHTLHIEEAEQIVRAARTNTHIPGLICLTKQPFTPEMPASFDASIWSLSTPDEFLERVFALLPSHEDNDVRAVSC